jgi:HAE1 family hydrophobic/amphiphilic exporter-1
MTLSDISIKRPVFAWMLMAALIVFGAISFRRLGVSQMPDVDFPVVSVSVNWAGAAPEVMESEIVDKLEQNLISVEKLKEITSTIRQGAATVTLEFDLKRDVDAAVQEVQSAISQVRLPLDVDPPVVRRNNPDDQPIVWVGFGGDRSLREIIEYVDLHVKDQFQILPGVGEIVLGGFTERNLRIWVDRTKLEKYELTILDVQGAIQSGQIETAAGVIENRTQELNVRMMGEGLNPEQVGEIVISRRGGRPIFGEPIRIKDVARVEDGLNDIRRISRISGLQGVGLGIKKQRGSNAVEVGDRVKAKVKELSATLPSDLKIQVNFDSTLFVKESIEETEFTLVLSALVTALVCFLFLGSWQPTLNILLSIPTSIVGAFMVIDFMGFTLNLFTILGLALAIGIVVDDAIMVLENIYRHRDMGKDRVTAAADGAREITFAAVAATIAVVAIFLPVAFMNGVIGKFFFQFGITITAAVLLSLLEAVTLTPMRCSQMMGAGHGRFADYLEQKFNRLAGAYRRALAFCLRGRWLVVVAAALLFAGSLLLSKGIRKEFIPPQDQSVFLMRLQAPVGSSLEFTSGMISQVEEFLKVQPEVARYFAAIGGQYGGEVNTGLLFVSMKPRAERSVSQADFMARCRAGIGKIQGLKVTAQDLSMRGFTAQRGYPVEFNIRGADWKTLKESADKLLEELSKTGLLVDVDTDYRLGQPEVRVWPKRDEAARRGVDVDALAGTVAAAIGGVREGKFTKDGRRYDVRIRLEGAERNTPEAIAPLLVRNSHGELVRLSDVVTIEETKTLQTITRRNRERSISVFANIAPGKSQSDALAAAQSLGSKVLPDGYRLYLGGGAQTFIESFQSLYFVLWLGVIVAYMVLASQFNSFIHPVIVLLALPFGVTGAFGALWLSDQSLNLYSMIGLILLM